MDKFKQAHKTYAVIIVTETSKVLWIHNECYQNSDTIQNHMLINMWNHCWAFKPTHNRLDECFCFSLCLVFNFPPHSMQTNETVKFLTWKWQTAATKETSTFCLVFEVIIVFIKINFYSRQKQQQKPKQQSIHKIVM